MAHCRQVISAASSLRTQAQRWLQIEDEYLGSVKHGAPSCGHSAAKKRHLHGNSFATNSRRSARSPSHASTSCSRQSWHRDAAINQAEILKTKSSMRTVKHTQQPRLKKQQKHNCVCCSIKLVHHLWTHLSMSSTGCTLFVLPNVQWAHLVQRCILRNLCHALLVHDCVLAAARSKRERGGAHSIRDWITNEQLNAHECAITYGK
jgi:hypothetical protein